MRGKHVRQICEVLDRLSTPGGATIRELMKALEVGRRSVERTLSNMQKMEFPIYDERVSGEREKRWLLEPSYVLKLPNTTVPNFTLTHHEVMCLYLLNRDDPMFKGTRMERHLKSLFSKLAHFYPKELTDALDGMRHLKVTKPLIQKQYTTHEAVLTAIAEAILSQEILKISYHAFATDTHKKAIVHPLHLFEEAGGLYLIAQKNDGGLFRTYAMERIKDTRSTGEGFTYPEGFSPGDYLSRTFGIIDDGEIEVHLRFSKAQARYAAERTWVKGQTLKHGVDGTVELCFKTRGIRDVRRWVLGWGADVEVLSPEWFRQDIRSELTKMLKKYE